MSSQKRFLPTPKKLRVARSDGDVARSNVASGVAAMLALVVSTGWGPAPQLLVEGMKRLLGVSLAQSLYGNFAAAGAVFAETIAWLLIPPLMAGVASEIGQVGWHISWKPLRLDFNRLNPSKGLKRLLCIDSEEGVMSRLGEALLPVFLAVATALVAVLALALFAKRFQSVILSDTVDLRAAVLSLIGVLIAFWAVVTVFVSVLDIFLHKHLRRKRLMMSFEELRREFRESEGDPETKGARRQFHAELLDQQVVDGIRKSRVVLFADRARSNSRKAGG